MCGVNVPTPRASAARRLRSEETGQVMIMTGLLLTIMLVIVALVVDIGHTMLVQRQLQAGVDAAALAGARNLADPALATSTANEFSPSATRKNAVNTVGDATTTVDVRCITTIPGCNTRYSTVNAISVNSSAAVPTFFAGIIGIDSLTVSARATACYPCVVNPLDIMIILDRTGSMCDKPGDNPNSSGNNDCTDLDAARAGIATFISLMDPSLVRIGFAVSPPAIGPRAGQGDSPGNTCAVPTSNPVYFGYDAWAPHWLTDTTLHGYRDQDRAFYVVSSLTDDDVDGDPSDDYAKKDGSGNWVLNSAGSGLVQTLACIRAGGSTSYAMAIAEAGRELTVNGRANVPNVVVFFTDGGANTAPNMANNYWLGGNGWPDKPCGSGVEAAKNYLPPATSVFTIGYDLGNETAPGSRCQRPNPSTGYQDNSQPIEATQTWGNLPSQALRAMVADPTTDFYAPTAPSQLVNLFDRLARDIQSRPARLVDNDTPELLE